MNDESDIDRLLQSAFESRTRGAGSSPSMVDVRHRARRHQRRRVGSVVGATAVLGVSGVAVLASRGGPESGIAGDEATTTVLTGVSCMPQGTVTTVEVFDEPTTTVLLPGTTLPSEATSTIAPPAPLDCIPAGQFRCIGNNGMDEQGYTYFEWCEPTDFTTATYPYPPTTMPDYTTYEVLETTTTFPPMTTTTESEFAPTTDLATTTT
jgi:hypothetical protein